jgi:uncharacterized membrane protein YphA (DoxX/SURF4 family)
MATVLSNARAVAVARVLLGFIFALFGLNGFLHFIPMPPPTGAALTFFGGLGASGYLFPLVSATQLISGILLLAGRYVTLALLLLAPVIVNIVLFHVSLAPSGLPLAILVLLLEVFLAWSYRDTFAYVVRARVEPAASSATRELTHRAA